MEPLDQRCLNSHRRRLRAFRFFSRGVLPFSYALDPRQVFIGGATVFSRRMRAQGTVCNDLCKATSENGIKLLPAKLICGLQESRKLVIVGTAAGGRVFADTLFDGGL